MFPKSFAPHVPIYLQIIEAFQRRFARGDVKPGDRLPAVRELAAQLLVNPNTVQRAYRELQRLGLSVTRRGLGTYVTGDAHKARDVQRRLARTVAAKYLEDMAALGFSPDEAVAYVKGARMIPRSRREE